MKTRKFTLAALALLPFSAAPFLAGPSRNNPRIDPRHTLESQVPTPPRVSALLGRSCYNCHSNETQWPWYSRAPFVSRMIERDVERGRRAMNFSEWSEQMGGRPGVAAANLLASCAAVRAGQMPKSPYALLHPEARLSRTDVDQLCGWANSQAQRLFAEQRRNRQR